MKKYLIKLLFLAVFFSLNSIAALGPEDLVKKTAEDVLFAIKQNKKFKKGMNNILNWQRKKYFQILILKKLTFSWVELESASDEQKKEFIIQFRTLLLKTYAVALSKYKNQKIEFKPTRMSDTDEIVIVKSEIIQNGAQPIRVNYALSKRLESGLFLTL